MWKKHCCKFNLELHIRAMQTISSTNFTFPNQLDVYHGKVRDVYFFDTKIAVIATDRISAFDHILPKPIPYKGQVLNLIATHFLQATKDICPNWLQQTPHPNVCIGIKCEPVRIEMVVRGYLAGHAARTYKAGGRVLCGVTLAEGLKENDKLPEPIITPSTKAVEGHDEDISREDILKRNLVDETIYTTMEKYALKLFARGSEMALKQGLILVDTKYEFGVHNGEVYLIDEIHTPDSSRYFYAEGYAERQAKGEAQQQLSKEFVREWLMANNFQGKDGQTMPFMPDSFVNEITNRYIQLHDLVTGNKFQKTNPENLLAEIETAVLKSF
ncbi:MAG: phosphoribosylaminoimidazolesuccinocarboxamide synthase [Chitinophagales bacterium]|nr:phosphoribosylaminoimidazolesuccinocarboxamide synthase [Chitinophagales bacterium]